MSGVAGLEELLSAIEAMDPAAQDSARAAVAAVLELHREGLAKIVAEVPEEALARLAKDGATRALLVLHELHPEDLATRAQAAIDAMNTRLARHEARAELASSKDGALDVRLVLSGASGGAPVARWIEDLEAGVWEAAPDAASVTTSLDDPSLLPAARLVRRKESVADRPGTDAATRCDLCAAPLGEEHEHLVDPRSRDVTCTCSACATLFSEGTGPTQRKRVRPRREPISAAFGAPAWDVLGVPVGLACFWKSSSLGRIVAMYPGPAGATESLLSFDAWDSIAREVKLPDLEPDVEALLVDRTRGRSEVWRVSIDRCFGLVGTIRAHWRGLTGGEAAWTAIDRYLKEGATHA